MKILDSKYYRPIKMLTEKYINGQDQIVVVELEDELDASGAPYSDVLNRSMVSVYFRNRVINRKYLTDFEQCTDYHLYEYNEKSEQFYCYHGCYFHPKFEIFVITNDSRSDDNNDLVVNNDIINVSSIYYNSHNPDTLANLSQFSQQYLEKYASNDAKISILIKDDGDLSFRKHKINPLPVDIERMYNDDFLPVHKKIHHDLNNTQKGVVMLHGISGSGKTNYLKWLTSELPDKDFIFVPNNMIEMLLEPSFISLLIDNKNSVIVLEDCENYILEREVAQSNTDVVASILNIADGILSDVLECQFICTFNAKLAKVDHALLRKGRLIAEYCFKELSVEKCNAYLESIDQQANVEKPLSLADLTNFENEEYLAKEETKTFGFI